MGAVLYRVRCLLRSRWRSSVLLGASVAVVGAIVLTFVAGAARTATAPDRYERAEGLRYDTAMEQESGPPLTDDIAALPSVESVTAATFFFGGLIPLGAEDPVEAIAFVGDPRGIGTQVLDGRLPAEDAPDEFVATRLWTEVAGAEIGDRFQLVTITEAAALANGFDAEPDGPSLEATLVGVVGGAAELQDEFPLAVFPLRLLEEGPIGLSATQSLVALADGADLAQLRTELDDLPDGDLLSLVPVDLVPQDFRRAVSTQANALLVIALITGVAGLVIVTQLAVRLVRQSDDQRQSLSALGLTRAQVLTDTLGRIAVPAVVGGFGAVGLAVLASGSFPRGFVARVEPDPGIDVDPWIHGPAVVLLAAGLLVVVGLVLVVGSRGRPSRPSSVADRLAGRLGTAWAAMGLRFAFARRARDAGSVSTPIAGLVALLAALVAAGTFSASLDDLLDDPDRQGLTFDLAAGQGGRTRVAEDVQVAILEDPDVEGLTLLGNTSVSVGEEAIDVTGYEPVRGEFVVTVLEGARPVEDDEIVLGRQAAEDLGLEVGDEVTAEASGGERRLRVTGLAVIAGIEGGEGLGEGGMVPADGFAALEPEGALSAAGIELREGADPDAVAARLSEATGLELGPLDAPGVISNLRRVRSAPDVVAGLLGVLVLVTVANLMIVAVQHRGREVALLRALGADRRWLMKVEHGHALVVVAVVAAVSVPLGIGVGRLVFRFLADQVGAADRPVVPWSTVLAAFGLLAVVADLVAQVMVRRYRTGVARRLAAE